MVMKECTIILHVSLAIQCLVLYMTLSEQNEDLTIRQIWLSILKWLSNITLRFLIYSKFEAETNSPPTLRGWRIGGGLWIEYWIDISVFVISLTYVSNKPDLSHIVISNVSFWGFKDKIFLIINSPEMVFYSTMVSSNDLPRDSE